MSEAYDYKEDNIVDLKLVTGGKRPPMVGYNWLKELGNDAFFTATLHDPQVEQWNASDFRLILKGERAMTLGMIRRTEGGHETIHEQRVDSDGFCKKWECIEIQYEGECDWTDNEGEVAEPESNDGEGRNHSMDENTG